MSESEKKKRRLYQKNREKWIFAQSVIVAVVTIAMLVSALVAYQLNKTYYIGYHENGRIDYSVTLKENEFYDSPILGKDQSYVASLIDTIIADFNYEISMDATDVNYRYSYTIKSRLEILDNTSDTPLFNPEYELINVQNRTQSSSSRLVIDEIIFINYDEYNDLANKFLDTYALTQTTSNIVVTLEVDVLSDCNAFSGSSVDTYTSELRIPLTTKTVNVEMTSTVPDAEAKMIACTRGAGFEVFKTTAIVLGVVDVLMILLLVAFTILTRTPDTTYAARVKKIVSQYKSYIQKINNSFDTDGYQVMHVDAFEEMLEIRDTIQAPILMFENSDKTCAKFFIPTDSKLLYLYEIKVDGYQDPPKPKKKAPTPPTTVVKPNITNVVRPVVKVVVAPPPPPPPAPTPAPQPDPDPEPDPEPTPEPVIETVIETPEVEVEATEEALPVVSVDVEEPEIEEETLEETPAEAIVEEVVEEIIEEPVVEEVVEEIVEEEPVVEEIVEEVEEIDEIDEILASIPEIDEEESNTVDVSESFWEERANYLCDSDEYEEEEKVVTPVPYWDDEDEEIIDQEAEVANGDYKVELNYPIKKLVKGARRKATKVFTALITPDDETDN